MFTAHHSNKNMRTNGRASSGAQKNEHGPEKQLVRHAEAHATGENRKQMKDKIKFNPEGNDKANELV